MKTWEEMSPRERDALVAERVMGWNVRGYAFAIHVEGEWSVRGDGDPDGWMCYAGTEPVYLPDGGPWYVDPPTLELGAMKYGASREDCEERFAKKLDQWKRDHERWGCHHYDLEVVPEFSTSIAAAWEVVEEMSEEFAATIESDGAGRWDAAFWAGDDHHNAWAPTASEAICLAALRAVGVNV